MKCCYFMCNLPLGYGWLWLSTTSCLLTFYQLPAPFILILKFIHANSLSRLLIVPLPLLICHMSIKFSRHSFLNMCLKCYIYAFPVMFPCSSYFLQDFVVVPFFLFSYCILVMQWMSLYMLPSSKSVNVDCITNVNIRNVFVAPQKPNL